MRAVYDEIAEHWDSTRYKPWPEVKKFIDRWEHGLLGDFGCGNGKNLPGPRAVGCDTCRALCDLCRQGDVQVADALSLPYRDGVFDAGLSIAVLHHISTAARRRQLVAEALRVVRRGGEVLFYAWARDQSGGASGHVFQAADVLVPWKAKSGVEYQRFCHVFEDGELAALVASVPGARVVRAYTDTGNVCVVAAKE